MNNNIYVSQSVNGNCNDVYYITDAEWEYDPSTGTSRLRVVGCEPATCHGATPTDFGNCLTIEESLIPF